MRREAAAQVGYLDPDFFVYSDEVDFARRLRDAGWRSVWVPAAVAIHHEQLSTDAVPERRIVEMARNRDLYMRKHHSPAAARAVRWLTAWAYALRALAALALPGHSPRRYWRHVTATLRPGRGEGLREAAAAYNREPTATAPAQPRISRALKKRVSHSSAGTSASHSARSTRPPRPAVGSSSSPETATPARIAHSARQAPPLEADRERASA